MPDAIEATTTPPNGAAAAAPPSPAGGSAAADSWESAKTSARETAEKNGGLVQLAGEVAAAITTPSEETAAAEGEAGAPSTEGGKEPPAEVPAEGEKTPERDITTERVPSSEWTRLLGREADLKKRTANRTARLDAREKTIADKETAAEAKVKEAEGRATSALERAKLVAAVESADPWESWQAFAAAKGWDEAKGREVLGSVFRRMANGGAASVDERIAAVEQTAKSEAERRIKEFEAKQAETEAAKKKDAEAAEQSERVKRAEQIGKADIVEKFTASIAAGQHPFLKAFHPEKVSEVVWAKLLDHYQKNDGELLEVDKVLADLNTGLKQEYERLAALDPERTRSSASQRSETDTGTGVPPRANPVTQRGNGSPPRVPTTVTPRLAAERSELRPGKASDADDWEESKRLAKLKVQ